jgi:hypothetical protein
VESRLIDPGFKSLIYNSLKSIQKKVKNPLRPAHDLITFAHRKIVLGGTTGRRTIRLRRPVFFCADRFFPALDWATHTCIA